MASDEEKIETGDVVEVVRGAYGADIDDFAIRHGLTLGRRFRVLDAKGGCSINIGTSPDGWNPARFKVVARHGRPYPPPVVVPTIHDVLARCPDQAAAITAAFPELFPKPLTWPELEDGEHFRFVANVRRGVSLTGSVFVRLGTHFFDHHGKCFSSSTSAPIIRTDRHGKPLAVEE